MSKPKAVMNWSSGKDSALALYKILQTGEFDVKFLLTTVNSHWQRISMHGVRHELLKKQSETIGIELVEIFLPELRWFNKSGMKTVFDKMTVYDAKI